MPLGISFSLKPRLRLRRGSSTGNEQPRFGRGRSRSLTGSVLGNDYDSPHMLIGDDPDLDCECCRGSIRLRTVSLDDHYLGASDLQMHRRMDLPMAYRPEMLATLEKQCRDFLR